ncbi:FAD-dependent pyridine nucleotide-disulphide oxidoreductase [Hymenobacter roseosalivarius DSM 11622]|uniref:NADH:ubiquinone reductase (non-electrogenic) n=1 Tax=Hymenobacter roseosalivarius DSM 11622 TaxID=645990 RepID=A0A1W1W190_9BACT|nr:NAD(P)/FAD-dependent oxidoreductase [Hymenobacter roseosalivarius]SMB98864.1 FAD-dependent pyridine nucleotide-disulphide oxidoreductase [Hymenobacter roseosalivarius DSM 11622]
METLTKIEDINQPRVVIVGGGFGGLELARALRHAPVQVVLIDKQNYHAFQPLLYQVATASLAADSIVSPFRKILDGQDNFYFRLAEALCVDTEQQLLETSIGRMRYDYLVLATGATSNFFGDEQMQRHAITLKTVADAIELRNTVLSNFEQALQLGDMEKINSLLDFVIVGGGPTGVEIAGALSELRAHVFPRDYRELDFKEMDIHLVQSGPVLLKGMSAEASRKSLEYLKQFGVQVWLDRRVKSYDGYTVTLNTGEQLITRTLIWAAGVTGSPIQGLGADCLLPGNRYAVNEFNQVAGYDNIFALGDIAAMRSELYPEGHPMVAQPALQQGRLLGENLMRRLKNEAMQPFRYDDKGSMATIGRNHAVADIKLFGRDLRLGGFLAWLAWSFVHVISLVSFRNRLIVLLNWGYTYFSYDKGLRYIIGDRKVLPPVEDIQDKAIT